MHRASWSQRISSQSLPPEPEPAFEGWADADDAPRAGEALIVNLEGFEGPLDLLLALARTQKVDLAKISVLALAEQYLEFVNQALKARLELAADYLVMAAWLAFLKSKLLLPREEGHRGPAHRRRAGGAPGLPPDAAGGHAHGGRASSSRASGWVATCSRAAVPRACAPSARASTRR